MAYRPILLGISIFLNLLLLASLLFGSNRWESYQTLKQECEDMQMKLSEIDAKNLALSQEIILLRTEDRYIEQMIRKRLNFVKNDEIWYVFPEKQNSLTGEGADERKN